MEKDKGTWVYYNGELYHAGVKGMSWGKHLPGTDWWKETTQKYYNRGNSNTTRVKDVDERGRVTFRNKNTPNFVQRVKGNLYTAGEAAKLYGRYAKVLGRHAVNNVSQSVSRTGKRIKRKVNRFWRDSKKYTSEQVAKLSEFAKSAYSEARKSVVNFFTTDNAERSTAYRNERYGSSTPLSHLDTFQNKQLDDAVKAYYNGKTNGSFGQKLNYWFQNAQYGIVKGVNSYLKQIGMDDKVDDFISKFRGDSSSRVRRKTNVGSMH